MQKFGAPLEKSFFVRSFFLRFAALVWKAVLNQQEGQKLRAVQIVTCRTVRTCRFPSIRTISVADSTKCLGWQVFFVSLFIGARQMFKI